MVREKMVQAGMKSKNAAVEWLGTIGFGGVEAIEFWRGYGVRRTDVIWTTAFFKLTTSYASPTSTRLPIAYHLSMPVATDTPTPAAAPNTVTTLSNSSLPPPATFDILPPLHALLARLLLPTNSTTLSSSSPQSSQSEQPLSPKDLATAASAITAKIQKARLAVWSMQGVEMGLQEQEEIIAELQSEVLRGKAVLQGLRESCVRAAADDMAKEEEMDATTKTSENVGAGKG